MRSSFIRLAGLCALGALSGTEGIGITIGGITLTVPGTNPTATSGISIPFPTGILGDVFGIGSGGVTRIESLFPDIPGFPSLPDPGTVQNGGLNTSNIQGDILVGMRKKVELFYFFSINNAGSFKSKVRSDLASAITNTFQLLSTSTQPEVALNVAFSQSGLKKIGINDNLADSPFASGQAADANNLGDGGTGNWVSAFVGTKIHGVFLLASDTSSSIASGVSKLESLFGSDITKQYSLQGNIRPGDEAGHEMFGYLDGIGQPAVKGFNNSPLPGQQVVDPGVILTGETGDTAKNSRPSWSKDGSFLVFRQLKQLVPEFNSFLSSAAPSISGLTKAQSVDLLGARMIGRWKSGAPVDLAPTTDDPSLGADPQRNNNFDFTHSGSNLASDQSRCPFSAHIRKGRPRADQASPLNAIIRAGIPYGPEVTDSEKSSGQSSNSASLERGLAFVSYQSQIGNGFQFIQTQWANNPGFPPGKNQQPQLDPIIGQAGSNTRTIAGVNKANTAASANVAEWVVSRGGEYFFSPSISALRGSLSA